MLSTGVYFFLKRVFYKEKNHDCSSFKLWSLPAEKERELGHTYSEVKGLKVTEILKDKAIAEV
jgi:hypothetical protein